MTLSAFFGRTRRALVSAFGLFCISQTLASSCNEDQRPPFIGGTRGIACTSTARQCVAGVRNGQCLEYEATPSEFNPDSQQYCIPDSETDLNGACQVRACAKCESPGCIDCVAVFASDAPGGCKPAGGIGIIGGGSGGSGGSGGGPGLAPGGPYHVFSIPFGASVLAGLTQPGPVQDLAFSTELGKPIGIEAKELLWVATAPNGHASQGSIFALDVSTNLFSLPPTALPASTDQSVAFAVTSELPAMPGARILLANFVGIAETEVESDGTIEVLDQLMVTNAMEVSPSPDYAIQPDIASAAYSPNRAVFSTNFQSPSSTLLTGTAQPVAVTSNRGDFWVLTQDASTPSRAGLTRFIASSALQLDQVDLGAVEAVAVDGGVGAEGNASIPGVVAVATIPEPGRGQLLLFHGGNPSDPVRGTIDLEGEPRALAVVEIEVGGGGAIQFAWVTLTTPRGGVVECYNLANGSKMMSVDIGAVRAIDMSIGLHPNISIPAPGEPPDNDTQFAYVHVLAEE